MRYWGSRSQYFEYMYCKIGQAEKLIISSKIYWINWLGNAGHAYWIDFSLHQHVEVSLLLSLNISCFQMSYEDESFKSAIDKGTLDALLPDTEHIDIAMSMLTDVLRVVKCMGSYMIVSLAQDHVLQTLVKSFQEKWANKIYSCVMYRHTTRNIS